LLGCNLSSPFLYDTGKPVRKTCKTCREKYKRSKQQFLDEEERPEDLPSFRFHEIQNRILDVLQASSDSYSFKALVIISDDRKNTADKQLMEEICRALDECDGNAYDLKNVKINAAETKASYHAVCCRADYHFHKPEGTESLHYKLDRFDCGGQIAGHIDRKRGVMEMKLEQ
jgi:hypothetical protein